MFIQITCIKLLNILILATYNHISIQFQKTWPQEKNVFHTTTYDDNTDKESQCQK